MKIIAWDNDVRQRSGSHYLCGNPGCKMPLEQPEQYIELKIGERVLHARLCTDCMCKANREGLSFDYETRYDE